MAEMMLSPELVELRGALAKIRAGRPCEIDPIRMLELFELFRDARQTYGADMAAAIATPGRATRRPLLMAGSYTANRRIISHRLPRATCFYTGRWCILRLRLLAQQRLQRPSALMFFRPGLFARSQSSNCDRQ